MNKLRLFSFFISSIIISFTILAEIPAGYYNKVEGTQKEELKSALNSTIKPVFLYKYGGSGDGYTWAGFYVTDQLEDNVVRDRYSNEIRRFNGNTSVAGMHIEHSFAKSWWGGTNNDAYKDLHHLYPSDGSANISKSNNVIGVVTETPGFDNGVIKTGQSTIGGGETTFKVWEPSDDTKGDFARTYMYMVTCYQDYCELWTGQGLNMLEKNSYPTLQQWAIDLLLEWNESDPVDQIEKDRNEEVYKIQGNRNPFIDYPTLAQYIWGNKMADKFYTSSSSDTELYIPAENEVFDFGLQSLAYGLTEEIVIRGRNLEQNLSVSISNPIYSINKSSFTPQEVEDGAILIVSCYPSDETQPECTITLSSGEFTRNILVKSSYINGIPAYEASEIVCTQNSKKFTANWMAFPSATTYSIDIYTKDESGSKTHLTGYPKDETNNAHTISTGVKANTTYYYTISTEVSNSEIAKSTSTFTSNEIKVDMPAVKPVFSASKYDLSFYTLPNRASNAQSIKLTQLSTPSYTVNYSTTLPFELSLDQEEWGQLIETTSKDPTFYVRVASGSPVGDIDGEITISTDGVDDLIVNLTGEVSWENALFENFENGSKSAYASASVELNSGSWTLDGAIIGNIANDKKNGEKSLRIRGEGVATMDFDNINGIGTLSFYAGRYGSDTGTGLKVEYSKDGGLSWINVIENLSFSDNTWKEYQYKIESEGTARVRFSATHTGTSKRVNVDDVKFDAFDPTSIDKIENESTTIMVHKNVVTISSKLNATLNVYDSAGKLLHTQNIKQGENNVNYKFEKGIYIFNISDSTTKKLIIN